MPAAGHPGDVENDVDPTAEHLREAGASGLLVHSEQNAPPIYHHLSHDCEGARCLCQRYENGELAAVVLNQNRNANLPGLDRERDADNYQNLGRGYRGHLNRANQNVQNQNPNQPNLNPHYQNPVDFLPVPNEHPARRGNSERERRQNEPEENIYERLDEVGREYGPSSPDHHTYERIDDRSRYRVSCRGGLACPVVPENMAGPSSAFKDFDTNRNFPRHDAPRNVYLESRRITSQSCLSRLGRNCFSTENIAYASRRYVYQLGHNCSCQFCRQLDARTACQYCNNFHDRLRHHDVGNLTNFGHSRHYIYQLPRSCRCPFCRGESLYARFPVNSRLTDSFRRECHCRNPGSCSCRSRYLSYSNPAIYIGRLDRGGLNHAVNNPLYANPAMCTTRSDRPSVSGTSSTIPANPADASPSTSSGTTGAAEAAATSSGRASNNCPGNSATSGLSVCTANRAADRQHVCDDSCIRNQNAAGIYQVLGRCERAECQHGRISIHWVCVNKWLPSWGAQNSVSEADANAEMLSRDEESRDRPDSDTEES